MRFVILAGVATLALAACDQGATNQNAPVPPGAAAAAVKAAPAGTNYTEQFATSPEGGMVMGNPNARVKLIEYLSMTCPHCARFSQEASEPLRRYVASGDVSYEVRNYIFNGLDISAALLARCNGPQSFFPISEQLFATQQEWAARGSQVDPAQLQNLPPTQQIVAFAEAAGLPAFVRMRGVPAEKASQCLTDQGAVQRLVAGTERASNELRVTATPTFFINGELADDPNGDGVVWSELEPQLRSAIG